MKRKIISIFLSVFVIATLCMSATTAFGESEPDGNITGDPVDVEEYYADGSTVYDLAEEVDTPLPPEETAPEEDTDLFDGDSEIYDDVSYDLENAAELSGADYVIDEIIIKFKDPVQVPGKEKQLAHEIEKFEKVGFIDGLGSYVVKVSDFPQNPNGVLNRLKNNKYIESVELNYNMKLAYVPNDPGYKTYQSNASNALNAPAGWDIMKGSSTPIVAVVDTGVAPHPDLPPLVSGYSATAGLSFNNDKISHGTSVAGVIGAIGDNGIGAAGLNWNASIMSVKIDDAAGNLPVANVAKGIIWAADNGAKIINLSLGTTADSPTLKSAVDYAYNRGCAIFAATGNDGNNSVSFPARYSNVMAVGATGNAVSRAPISNYGPGLNIVALTSYYTTIASGIYSSPAGTSFSSPQVAGLASLIWAINPKLTNEQVYRLIEQGAKPLGGGFNEQTGYGFIDVGKTLQLAQETAGTAPGTGAVKPDPVTPETPSVPVVPVLPETPQEVRTPPVITLKGFASMTLENGQAYSETGFTAVDCKGLDLTSSVRTTGSVDIWTAGLYTITYEVSDSAGLTAKAIRSVTVKAPVPPPPPQAPKITIIGSNPIILHQTSSTPYKEQSARAVDYDGTDISSQVKITGSVNRTVAGTYKLTYSITGKDGVTATATRDVRILAPTEKKDPRTKYGLSGQAKQGGKVTHTGITSSELGFLDLTVRTIDKNMTITAQLIDTATKKAVLTDTFSAAGTKQYRIDKGKYELAVTVDKASGNSKYDIDLLMPETAAVTIFDSPEVPLAGLPRIAPIGSNPIILHVGGTPYTEQGARAVDFMGDDISDQVVIEGTPDTSKAGSYTITYKVKGSSGKEAVATREVRVLAPNIFGVFADEEVPLAPAPVQMVETPQDNTFLYVAVAEGFAIIGLVAFLVFIINRKKVSVNAGKKEE